MYSALTGARHIGRELIYLSECSTTNSELQRFVRSGENRDGLVLITDNQYAGRGQGTRTWLAEPGKNLTFSILLKNPVQPTELFYLNIFCALAVADVLRTVQDIEPVIKWPNDVWVGDCKISGILIESTIQGNEVPVAIAGIGLNVNQKEFNLPHATSLALLTGREWSTSEILSRLLFALDNRYDQLRGGHYEMLKCNWMKRLFRLGILHTYEDDRGLFTGTITGVDAAGRLMVETENGTRHYASREIKYL